jgi:hypothetical protein
MSIKTGIGIGEAQVFDTKDIVNNFYKQYQLRQKEDQLFAEKLADNLSKFDTSNLTGKDLERANQMYDQLKNYNQDISRMSRMDKALLDAKIRKGMNDIKTFSSNARQFYKDRENFGVEYKKDKYSFVPELEPVVEELSTLSYGEALDKNLGDINSLRMKRAPDNRLVDESLDDMAKIVKGLADKTKPITITQKTPGGTSVNQIYHVADPKAVDAVVLGIISDSAKKFNWVDNFKRAFPEQPTPDDETLVKYIKNAYETKSGGIENAYRFKTSEQMAPKPTAGPKPTDSDQFADTLNNSFSSNTNARASAINKLKAHAKGRIVDIVDNGDGTLTVTPYIVKVPGMPKEPGKPIPVGSPGELNDVLGSLTISSSGFGVVTKLNQGPAGGSIITYVVNGEEYKIPSSKSGAFLKQFPNAKKK